MLKLREQQGGQVAGAKPAKERVVEWWWGGALRIEPCRSALGLCLLLWVKWGTIEGCDYRSGVIWLPFQKNHSHCWGRGGGMGEKARSRETWLKVGRCLLRVWVYFGLAFGTANGCMSLEPSKMLLFESWVIQIKKTMHYMFIYTQELGFPFGP